MKKTALIALLLVVLGIFCFMGCSQDDDGDILDRFQQLVEELDSETQSAPASPFANQVYLVIPELASAELKAKAFELSKAIYDKTQVDAMVKYDYEEHYSRENDLTIFIGNTNRFASRETVSRLRKGEYLCKWYGDDIVIGAREDTAAIAAVDEFIDVILPGASNGALMSSGARLEHKGEYEVAAVTLNGYDLYDYTFVCGEDTLDKVKILADYIECRSGYMVTVCDENDSVDGKKISFLLSRQYVQPTLEPQGQSLSVCASDEYRLSVVMADFAKRLFENVSDGVAAAEISQKFVIPAYSGSLKICAAWYLNNGKANIRQITDMVERIQTEEFDVVLLDKLNAESLDDISFNMTKEYGIKTLTHKNGENFCVVYKKATLDSVECEISGEALVINAVAKGESVSRKIIKLLDAEAEPDDLLDGYDVVISCEDISEEYLLDKIGDVAWSFAGNDYSCVMLTSPALCIEQDGAEKVEVSDIGYMNVYLYADISVEYCAEFETLKDAVN